MNDFNEVIQNKKYGWLAFFVFSFMAGVKVAGIVGSIGAGMIAVYLYRIVVNEKLSKHKKLSYSILLVVCGLIATAVCYFILLTLIGKLTGSMFTNEPQVTFIIDSSDSAPLTIEKNGATNLLAEEYYESEPLNFKVRAPIKWELTNMENAQQVQFTDIENISDIILYSEIIDNDFDIKQYAAGYILGSIQGGALDLKVTNKGQIMDVQNSYYVEFEYSIELPNKEKIRLKSLTTFVLHNDEVFVGSIGSEISIWNDYKDRLMQSLSSFEPLKI